VRLDALFAASSRETALRRLSAPFDPDAFLRGDDVAPTDATLEKGDWEVEIGFGKGRYLLDRAAAHPERRFLGIEVASKYFRICRDRIKRRGLSNAVVVRGEALYLLTSVLPAGFASVVHVYFPDPWPKERHHKRRLFEPETVDLVVGLLRPGGELAFATDHVEYGELVSEILAGYPALAVERRLEPWDDGPRTHYESKYMVEGRPILRLRAVRTEADLLHPQGRCGVLVGPRAGGTEDCASSSS
jgi:tRNA (guanine-N7-)-methyltransferase